MHIKGWCAALGAAALFQGASATVTVESTYTSTKTVVRVMEPTGDSWSSSSGKAGPTGYAHGTGWSGNSTAKPTWSASQSAPAVQTTGAASHLALDTLGLAAIAGIAGLFAL